MKNIYILGGSPCCGKSTIAERISNEYGFHYYKADDFLDKYIPKGKDDKNEWLTYVADMTIDQLWLRDPYILNEEELLTYEKLFPYFISDLEKIGNDTPIITEGAAFLPSLVRQLGMPRDTKVSQFMPNDTKVSQFIDKMHYVCIVPTKEFQLQYYKKRLWVNDYLSSCSDKEKAYNNWMERDALFALSVLEQANKAGYTSLIVDGSKSIDENFHFVIDVFGIKK